METMTHKDKQSFKRKLILYTKLAYSLIALFALIFLCGLIVEIGNVDGMTTHGKFFFTTSIFVLFVMFFFYVKTIYYSTRLKVYKLLLNYKRSKHNFKIGLNYINNDEFEKALDVVNSIPNKETRVFLFNMTLFMGMNSKDDKVVNNHKKHIDKKIKEFTS